MGKENKVRAGYGAIATNAKLAASGEVIQMLAAAINVNPRRVLARPPMQSRRASYKDSGGAGAE